MLFDNLGSYSSMAEHSPDKRETKDRYLVGTPNMGMRRSWRVAADCKSVPVEVSWFESIHPHQNVALV